MLVWELISDTVKVQLIQFQWDHFGNALDLFKQTQTPEFDHIPEEENLGKFMAEAPHKQAHVS
jgi:hypothetical protein